MTWPVALLVGLVAGAGLMAIFAYRRGHAETTRQFDQGLLHGQFGAEPLRRHVASGIGILFGRRR